MAADYDKEVERYNETPNDIDKTVSLLCFDPTPEMQKWDLSRIPIYNQVSISGWPIYLLFRVSFGYNFTIFQLIFLKFLHNLPTQNFVSERIIKFWQEIHQICPKERKPHFWFFALWKISKYQNWTISSGNKSNPTKSIILNNFCSNSLPNSWVFAWICICDASDFYLLCKFTWKTPEFGKVLEQKLFRMVDLVGFDLFPDEIDQFWNFDFWNFAPR